MRKLFLVFTALSVVAAGTLSAQEDVLRPKGRPGEASSASPQSSLIRIGADVGIGYHMFAADVSTPLEDSFVEIFESGDGISPFADILVDFSIGASSGIQLKLGYDIKEFSNDGDWVGECNVLGVGIVEATQNSEYEFSTPFFTLGLLYRHNFTPNLFITAGPTFHFAGDVDVTTTSRLLTPDECSYDVDGDGIPDGDRVITSETTVEADNSTRIGLELGIGYLIELSERWALVPKAGFQFMFTPFTNEEETLDPSRPNLDGFAPATLGDGSLHSLQLSIGLLYTL